MKKMILLAALSALALTSCRQDLVEEIPNVDGSVFTAVTEGPATRTELQKNGDAYQVVWCSGDRITIVDAAATPNVGVYETAEASTRAQFTLSSGAEAATPAFKAYYPAALYNDGAPALPATQAYVAGNISGSPMYAESESTSLTFKNLCGIVRLNVSTTQTGKKVRKIVLTADKGLSGAITNAATLAKDGYAAAVAGKEGVTLDCGEEGVAIGEEALSFHIAVPAGSYNPLTVTVITTDGEVQARASTSAIEIARSSIATLTLGFGALGETTGSADVYDGSPEPWVQLWPGGPKWACFNVGSTIYSYAGVTEYTHPGVTGGYYSYRGKLDSTPNANATEDTAAELWGPNWATPTREQQQALLDNCEWTYCDGTTVQFAPGCTLAGWKVSGKEPGYTENSIFLPLAGVRDQNSRARQSVGGRGCYWSATSGGSGAYYMHCNTTGKEMNSHNQPHGCSVRAICVGNEQFPSIEDDDLGVYADLSAGETANTYIVSAAGKYKFNATVKGNGGLDPVTGEKATTLDPAAISGVTVLWELQERGRAIEFKGKYQICYAGGYVYFRTPEEFVRGDAYVAVFKDGEGGRPGRFDKDVDEILWSWLIWTTEVPGMATHKEAVFMDRNIGAWGTNETFSGGFAYQWGRPCPFSASYNKNYAPYPYYPDRTTQAFRFEAIGEGKTVSYSTSHPETFFYGGRSCWMPDDGFYNNLWADNEKTIYDPSPIGYKVPSKDQLDGITGSMSFYGTGFIGYGSSRDFGYGNPGSILLWSSTSDDEGGYRGAWAYAYNGMTKKYGSYPDVYFASGIPVRCVKEVKTVDLGAEGSANCYLVPAEGKYKFKATVKGNGAADHSGIAKDTDPATIAKAELVWATFNTTVAPAEGELIKDIQYKDGYVSFSTGSPYKEGNALVAIKDADGTILWSWHLWFESDDMAAKAQTDPVSTYVFMDRNLGALTNCYNADDALDFGFTYQRGRKDPFMTSATRTRYTALGVLGTYTSYTGGSNVANSIKNPTVVFGTDSWGGGASQWSAASKTIFDPCPPGWHIPGAQAWTGFNATNFVVYKGDWNTYHGRLYNGEAWYPATGDRWGSNHNNTGDRLDQWGERELYASQSSIDANGGSNPGHGYSVRCVKD